MKKLRYIWISLCLAGILAGCGDKNPTTEATSDTESAVAQTETTTEAATESNAAIATGSELASSTDVVEDWMTPIAAEQLNNGTYAVTVDASSSMFRIVSCELTVADGKMTAVMTMSGKGYRYLYMGTPEEAVAAEETDYIPYEEDADGNHTFTVEVPALDAGVYCAAFSDKKEKWYARTLVFRSDSLPAGALADGAGKTADDLMLEDGIYMAEVTLSGGSGKASVESPARLTVADGSITATIVMSSPNYDYMMVDGTQYLPVNTDGNSTFEIPVSAFDYNMPISADTTAMSQPHEIEYTLYFDSSTIVRED